MEELIFGLIGGTTLLMYGVDMMGDGLEKASGETMKKILTVLTGNVWSSFIVGVFVTAIVQSSTAVTLLTVGFVNSGIMGLSQALGIIYGANIGTTITAQLMAFSFKFKLTDVALPIFGIGFLLNQIGKKKKFKNLGQAMMGFGMMFLGLKILNSGIPYMEESKVLRQFFANYASIPFLGIALGIFVTAMVHSSAATIGLVMILSKAGLLDLESAIYIMLGDNIGTCFTAQLASMTGNINARRTAWAHTFYNIFGVVLTLITLPIFMKIVIYITDIIHFNADVSAYIANSHTLFNTLNAIIFLPMTRQYVKFLERVIVDRKDREVHEIILDDLLLNTPMAALEASRVELVRGTKILKDMVRDAMKMIYNDELEYIPIIENDEKIINNMQKEVTRYIVKLSKKELTERESIMVPAVISSINNIERAGDRVIEIMKLYRKKVEENLPFTDNAMEELEKLEDSILQMIDDTVITLRNKDNDCIERILQLEDEVDIFSDRFQQNHIKRLNDESCNIDAGVIYIDIIAHLERIADYIYKIGMLTKDELHGNKRI